MRQNALLRSAKGSGVPGTARKKDTKICCSGRVGASRRAQRPFRDPKWRAMRRRAPARGPARREGLDDIDLIETTLRRCVDAAGATLLHIHLHHFQPNGVSGVAVLAVSHISIHTWPEVGYAALDLFMLVTQNGVPIQQSRELTSTIK
jgi:S-adenosylmethionine decarboxylase